MKTLYYDCFAGISGDMHLGAMVDLGVDPDYLSAELGKLGVPGFHLDVKPDQRRGIGGSRVKVVIDNPEFREYSVPVETEHDRHHEHADPHHHHEHRHDGHHDQDHHHGDHSHHPDSRHLHDIEALIINSPLSDNVKALSMKIFRKIAEAESKVHQIPIEQVHFHEVGALDSIADIVGAAICIDYLKVDRILASPVQLGSGMVKCRHGLIPVPAPATLEILKNVPVRTGLVPFEATTPTGAAILTAVVDEFTENNRFTVKSTGYGIGGRDSEVPNVLRVFLCEDAENRQNDTQDTKAAVIECNIDDMNPEHYDYLLERLFEAGAVDAWMTPIVMKKTRPAVLLSALCEQSAVEAVKRQIFTHSTTLGVRTHEVSKSALRRESATVETQYGQARVKKSFYNGKTVRCKPESDDCRRLASTSGLTLAEIENIISRHCELEKQSGTGNQNNQK